MEIRYGNHPVRNAEGNIALTFTSFLVKCTNFSNQPHGKILGQREYSSFCMILILNKPCLWYLALRKKEKAREKWCICSLPPAIFRLARKPYLAAFAHPIWQLLSVHHSQIQEA